MGQVSGSDVGVKVCIVWMKSVRSVESGGQESYGKVSTLFDQMTALTVLVDTVPSAPAQVQTCERT